MPYYGESDGSDPRTEDQEKWYEAMSFCDDMECECELDNNPPDFVGAAWWKEQGKRCYANIQMGLPYQEKYQGVV